MKNKTNLPDADVWNLHFFLCNYCRYAYITCLRFQFNQYTFKLLFIYLFFLPSTQKSMMRCHVLLVISIHCSVSLQFKLFCLFLSQEMIEQGCLETLSHTRNGCYQFALCIHLHMQGTKLSFTTGDVNSLQVCFSSNEHKHSFSFIRYNEKNVE